MCHWSQTIFFKVSAYLNLECGVSKGSVSSGRQSVWARGRETYGAFGRVGTVSLSERRIVTLI
jgi:hypothetical protein